MNMAVTKSGKEGEGAEGGAGGAFTDIEDPVSKKELVDIQDKLEDREAEIHQLDQQLRVEERLKSKLQTELRDKERELHKFLVERDNEIKGLVDAALEDAQSSAGAQQAKEKERQERKAARNKEREDRAKVDKIKEGKDTAPAEDDYSEADKQRFKAIFDLVRFNKYKDVEKLVKDGCPVDWRDPNGYTALMVAAQNGLKRIIKTVMRYNCDLNAQNSRGHTACHLAVMYDHSDLMDYMVSKGARDDILNDQGKTCREATK